MPKSKVRKSAKKKKRKPFYSLKEKKIMGKCWNCGCVLDASTGGIHIINITTTNQNVYTCHPCALAIEEHHLKMKMKKAISAI